jgi:hypothetical protein
MAFIKFFLFAAIIVAVSAQFGLPNLQNATQIIPAELPAAEIPAEIPVNGAELPAGLPVDVPIGGTTTTPAGEESDATTDAPSRLGNVLNRIGTHRRA